ncbi:MAG: hypothetical protein J6328_00025 [Bacilli bacterium]|nr:hypothetical protein [Bacilli bacterium]
MQKTTGTFKTVKVILIVLTCLSLFFGLMLIAFLDRNNEGIAALDQSYYMVSHSWVFFLLLPISLGCLGYGIFLLIRKFKGVSNIIVGLIFSLLLSVYGSFTAIFKPQFDTSSKQWDELGLRLGIDFSDDLKVVALKSGGVVQRIGPVEMFEYEVESTAVFRRRQSYQAFVDSLDDRWLKSYPSYTVPNSFYAQTLVGFDRFLIYSFADSTYFPKEVTSGNSYVCIGLSFEKQGMYMIEYRVK